MGSGLRESEDTTGPPGELSMGLRGGNGTPPAQQSAKLEAGAAGTAWGEARDGATSPTADCTGGHLSTLHRIPSVHISHANVSIAKSICWMVMDLRKIVSVR